MRQSKNIKRENTLINPMFLIAEKQRVGQEDANSIALTVLVWLDAAKRGKCTAPGCNHLTIHLIIASYIASKLKSRRFHDQVTAAYAALKKASDRETRLLDLTTGEHKAIAAAIKTYLCALANVEVGTMNDACLVAAKAMEEVS